MNLPPNILTLHPDPLIRAGIMSSLRRQAEFEVFYEDSDGTAFDGPPIDVVVAEYHQGMRLADVAVRAQRACLANARILVLTANDREADIRRAMEVGLHGYLLLGGPVSELTDAVATLASGGRYIGRGVAQRMMDSFSRASLTSRECEVLRLVVAVFAATLASRVGVPVPAPAVLMAAGALVAERQLEAWIVVAAALVASVIGDALWFAGGRHQGPRLMRLLALCEQSRDRWIRGGVQLMVRWGGASLIGAKFIPGLSVAAAPVAGALRMPWGTFTACALAGAAVWTALFMGAGAVFHRQILATLDAVGHFGTAMLVLLTAILGLRWGRRLRGRLKRA